MSKTQINSKPSPISNPWSSVRAETTGRSQGSSVQSLFSFLSLYSQPQANRYLYHLFSSINVFSSTLIIITLSPTAPIKLPMKLWSKTFEYQISPTWKKVEKRSKIPANLFTFVRRCSKCPTMRYLERSTNSSLRSSSQVCIYCTRMCSEFQFNPKRK